MDFGMLRDYATGVLGWSIDEFWRSTPWEYRGREEKRQREDLAALAYAIAGNSNREKIVMADIYKLIVREPIDSGADEEVEEAIFQESKAEAIKAREKEIRRLIDKVMACQQ